MSNRLVYDQPLRSITLSLATGQLVRVDLDQELTFLRESGAGQGLAAALFLTASELETLEKMIAHVLNTVQMSAGGRKNLERILEETRQGRRTLAEEPAS